MKIICGLGNPGENYANTRHNCGFMVIDELARNLGVSVDKKRFEAKVAETFVDGQKVLLMKPETYMNNSGVALRQAMDYYKVDPEDVLIIYDDLDTPVGSIRLRQKGSAGGHNGIKSIIQWMMTDKFNRIRVGIGRNPQIPIIEYVLTRFRPEERQPLLEAVQKAADAARTSVRTDFNKVMSDFNPKAPKKNKKEKDEKRNQIMTLVDPKGTDVLIADEEIETTRFGNEDNK